MAGWVHPAMDGPAGQQGGQDAAGGAGVAEEVGPSRGDGLPEGNLVTLRGNLRCRHARHSGLVRYLGRVLENEATVGRGFGGDFRGNAVDKRRFRARCGVARAAAGVADRAMDGHDRGRREAGLAGQAMADYVSKVSHPTDACRRSALSGI